MATQTADRGAQPDTGGSVRRRLLELLRSGRQSFDGHQLAAATGLHVTTVRFHLAKLIAAGLVSAQSEPRTTPGRPRIVYSPLVLLAQPDGYQGLAAVLAEHLGRSATDRGRRAERAGRRWAGTLVAPSDQPISEDATAQRVTTLFDELRFEPELGARQSGGTREIALRGCPYRDVARRHPEVVCSIHLGLLRGALTQLASPGTG
ncbi:MAG: helix-turn-helix transcriptional regulator [Nakamurella sp.]